MTEMAPSTRWSFEFLARLISRGITDIVMSPGSRSQSLALAAAQFEAAGLVNLHVVVDERTAGFVALGLSIETGRPAVVACTSGSSVANLHPAVVEAHHAGVPMLVVTADRPLEVRTTGGNQTTVQPGMFAGAVGGVWDFDATDSSIPDLGTGVADEALLTALAQHIPVHINPQFREPLSSPIPDELIRSVRPGSLPTITAEVSELNVLAMAGTVVIAGAGAGPRAERWARELGAPLIAEVNSGAHYGPHLVVNYREALSNPDFRDQITSVIVVGRPTLSRAVDVLCQSDDVDVIVVRGTEAFRIDPGPVCSSSTTSCRPVTPRNWRASGRCRGRDGRVLHWIKPFLTLPSTSRRRSRMTTESAPSLRAPRWACSARLCPPKCSSVPCGTPPGPTIVWCLVRPLWCASPTRRSPANR